MVDFNFELNVSKFQFINEFVFTDKAVDKTTEVSGSFNLREGFYTSVFPYLENNNFLTGGSKVYSWSSQFSYSANLYNKEFIPYVSYSQIQKVAIIRQLLLILDFATMPLLMLGQDLVIAM